MNKQVRNVVIEMLRPKLDAYELKLRHCFEKDNKEGMKTWIKQIEETVNFLDGVPIDKTKIMLENFNKQE